MEENNVAPTPPSIQQPSPPMPTQSASPQPISKKNKFVSILEWGFFELVFVGGMLFLLFFTLNYFHLLQFSTISKRLSLLPYFPSKPTPTPVLNPDLFAYNFPTADDLLTKYVYTTLQPDYLPTASPSSNIGLTQQRETFSGNWLKGKNTLVKVTFSYTPFTNTVALYKIFVNPADLPTFPPSSPEALSQQLTQLLIKTPPIAPWTCKHIDQRVTFECTNIFSNDEGKRLFAVDLQQTASSSAIISSSLCFIPTGSTLSKSNFHCEE